MGCQREIIRFLREYHIILHKGADERMEKDFRLEGVIPMQDIWCHVEEGEKNLFVISGH